MQHACSQQPLYYIRFDEGWAGLDPVSQRMMEEFEAFNWQNDTLNLNIANFLKRVQHLLKPDIIKKKKKNCV